MRFFALVAYPSLVWSAFVLGEPALASKPLRSPNDDLEATFRKLDTSDGHVSEELDIVIGKSIKESPAEFLTLLRKYRLKVNRLDALLGNLGPELVDNFKMQADEVRQRIRALESVSDAELKFLAVECIGILQQKLIVLEAPMRRSSAR
jgi:hypothetical protein